MALQFTPHDVNDIDATEIPILLDAEFGGRPASSCSSPTGMASTISPIA
jgi:hypothetical protein